MSELDHAATASHAAARPPRMKLDEAWILRTSDLPVSAEVTASFALHRFDPVTGRSVEELHGIVLPSGPCTKTMIFILSETPTLRLQAVPQPRGGQRWRFRCSTTGVLCATLIRPPGAIGFVSRKALGPTSYPSQRRSPRRRAADRAAKLRAALGGSPDFATPFPERPARMRRATFARLRAEAEASAAIALAGRPLATLTLEHRS